MISIYVVSVFIVLTIGVGVTVARHGLNVMPGYLLMLPVFARALDLI